MALLIGKSEWEAIRLHGEQSYPNECCGVLVGSAGADGVKKVQDIVRCGNARNDSPQNRYQISPAELVRIQREAHEHRQDIIGFYHSHPDHPASWSATDLAEAHWIGCSYVITSVKRGRADQTNSFHLAGEDDDRKHFEDEEIEIR